jgi:uncharacterized protein YgbK (DUF1537 family)
MPPVPSDEGLQPLRKSERLAALPPVWPHDLCGEIRSGALAARSKLVVLDDDPTGTQTVYDVPVITEWSLEALRAELAESSPGFYILTNSRSMPQAAAEKLNREIAENLRAAARSLARDGQAEPAFSIVSRSDSTLRGHFPCEVEVLGEVLGPFDAVVVAPFFEEGGRFTIDDVHYVAEGDWLVPAAATPFARDAVFGYRSSNLRQWIAEKTAGRVAAAWVQSIDIDELRRHGPEAVRKRLVDLPRGSVLIVNAAAARDLEVFVLGLIRAEAQGRRFLFRTAASFVAARLGLAKRPLLAAEELASSAPGGGLIVVGSYVPKTTEQLERLLAELGVQPVELDVAALLDRGRRDAVVEAASRDVNRLLEQGHDAVLFTSRQLVTRPDAAANLEIGRRISDALVEVVRRLGHRPRHLIAKGGITSSDVATRGLGVRRAVVRGQILPGVPVWQLGPETRFPGLPYVVFPGNGGGPFALVEAAALLSRRGA